MTEPIQLRTDGPFDPDYLRQVAGTFAETVRVMNHATLGDTGALEYPSDAYSLLGHLYTGTGRMPQLVAQLNAFLDGWQASGQLGDSNGGDPTRQAASAAYSLGEAHVHALKLTEALQKAQNAISGLYVREGDDA